MKIDGEYTFDAPRDAVWEALLDPAVLATVLPGCEKLEKTGDNAYDGALKIKVGPVQGKFAGKIVLDDIEAPHRYTMKVDGRGAPGFVKATAQVVLEDGATNARTRLGYESKAQVGGRIASVGQRLLDSSAKAIIKQSLEGLNAALVARMAMEGNAESNVDHGPDMPSRTDEAAPTTDPRSQETAGPAPEPRPTGATPALPQPPSQATFARNVAKEVVKDLVPKPVLVIGAVLAAAAVLLFAFR